MSAPLVTGPTDLPALRVWMLDQWRPGRPFWSVGAQAMLDSTREVARMSPLMRAAIRQELTADQRSMLYARAELNMLGQANLWYVAAEMCTLLQHAYAKVPDDVRVEDLPEGVARSGLAVFEQPLTLTTREGGPMHVHAYLWGGAHIIDVYEDRYAAAWSDKDNIEDEPFSKAIVLSSYQRFNLDEGLRGDDLARAAPALSEAFARGDVTSEPGTDDDGLDDRTVEQLTDGRWNVAGRTFVLHGEFWAPCGRSDWPITETLGEGAKDYATDAAVHSALEDRRVLAALWTLVNQHTITTQQHVRPARPVVRRVQRAGLPKAAADVRVVVLRKLDTPGDTEHQPGTGRKLDHRVIVGADTGGFWRNQPHGPRSSQRKLIWIDPYVRGPEDAPLRQPETVRLWKR